MSRKRYLQVTNFDELQHYKDRNPIWIKLYCSILDDYEFSQIPDETKYHAVALMLLASRLNNKFPEDEVWLRQKINANSEIDLKLLLEIGFLEVVKTTKAAKRKRKTPAKKQTKPRKSNKTKEDLASTGEKVSLAQNKTEQKKKEENTTQQTNAGVSVDSFKSSENSNGHLSRFSIEECLQYVKICQTKGDAIRNPQGLATNLYQTGNSDAFILAALYPEESEIEIYGKPVQFKDEPCRICFGGKMADTDGKGFGACRNCKDEKGKSTGFEPQEEDR